MISCQSILLRPKTVSAKINERFQGAYLTSDKTDGSMPVTHDSKHRTFFFRNPELWHFLFGRPDDPSLPGFLAEHFKAKLPKIINIGASVGHEAYTIAMGLRYRFGDKAAKQCNMIAFDLDESINRIAREGLLWIGENDKDIKNALQVLPAAFLKQCFKPVSADPNQLNHYKALLEKAHIRGTKSMTNPECLYPVAENIKKLIHFKNTTINHLKPFKEPMLMIFRGGLGLYKREAQMPLIQTLAKIMPAGSVLITGGFDNIRGVPENLVRSGFTSLIPVGAITGKNKTLQANYPKADPRRFVFIRNEKPA